MNEEKLFLLALDKASDERGAFLEEVCDGDLALCQRVGILLQAHDHPDNFLVQPVIDPHATKSAWPDTACAHNGNGAVGPGTRIAHYRLLHLIGEGGMGAVYLAEQEHPVQRRVALKVIKPGMDSQRVIARFEAERQALALMDHPNIAKVHDGGTVGPVCRTGPDAEGPARQAGPTGQPYFVMELVEGISITKYCDANRLTVRHRLNLFTGVCHAVQHAHQKGVIHRDLKPSNMLIAQFDGQPVPKVIDFGVAKATGLGLGERTLFTEIGTLVGTLEYMSPEQAQLDHSDVDTRSDIYSLGVILYELLTGTTPLEHNRLKDTGLLAGLQLIRDEEPPRPSARLGTTSELAAIAANRGAQPSHLINQVRGDLDRIVMKALQKDRNQRYESANGLALDLQRFLNDEPVQACPPSTRYRAGKFLRRNRRALITTLMLLLAIGTVAGSLGWVTWDRATRRKTAQSGVDAALDEVERLHEQGKWLEVEVPLRKAEAWLSASPIDAARNERVQRWRQDLTLVKLLDTIRLRSAMAEQFFSPDTAYARAFSSYGLEVANGDLDELAARIRASAVKDQLVSALQNWGWSAEPRRPANWKRLIELSRRAESDSYRDLLQAALLRRDHKALVAAAQDRRMVDLTPATAGVLIRALEGFGERDLSARVCQEIYARHPGDLWFNLELAELFTSSGHKEKATGYWRAFLALRPQSAEAHVIFGRALITMGRPAEAEFSLHQAVRLEPDSYLAHDALGQALMAQGRHAEAESSFRRALASRQAIPCIGNYYLALALVEQCKIPEARIIFEKACAYHPKPNGPVDLAVPCYSFGSRLIERDRFGDAIPYLRKAIQLQPDFAEAHCNLAQALERTGQFVAARNAYRVGHQQGSRNPAWRYPSATWLRNAERKVYLDCKLPAILRGETQPRDDVERLGLAEVCGRKRLYVRAVRFYIEAFAAAIPAEKLRQHRYDAACYAVLAAGGDDGEASPVTDQDRSRLRRQALLWLHAELYAHRQTLDSGLSGASLSVATALGHWLADEDLNGVRAEKALARLPEPERRDWQRLWKAVEDLRRTAAGQTRA